MSVTFDTSVKINAPAEKIYAYVSDFPRHVEWCNQPQQMTALQNGPTQVGSRYRTEEGNPRNMPLGQKMMFAMMRPLLKVIYGVDGYTEAEVVALEDQRRVAWKARLPSRKKGDLMRMNWEIRLQAENGGTVVTQQCEIAPPDSSPMKAMVNDDLAQQSKAEVAANLQRLKFIAEAA